MPNLTPGDLHVNKELSTVMVAYAQQTDEFVADKVFPNIPVEKQTDFYYKFGRKSYLQTQAKKRAPSTETPGVEWTVAKDTYAAEVWGLHHDIEDQLRSNADDNFNLDSAGTELITQQMLLRREKEWLAAFFTTGVWVQDVTFTTVGTPGTTTSKQWDQAGSSPITDFRKVRLRSKKRSGLMPNVAVFGMEAWDGIIDHVEIVDRVKYTQQGFLTEALVSKAIGIDKVVVASAVEATDQEEELVAVTNVTTQFLAGKNVLIAHAAKRPSKNVPSAGYTFSWKGYLGASAFGGRIKKYREERIASDRIEIEMAYDMKIVAPELGEFFSAVVA